MEIALGDAVAALRDELLSAAARNLDAGIDFVVGPVELEFEVELKTDVNAKFGFKAWVLAGDVAAGGSRSNTHRVKLTLTPRRPDGSDVLVASAGVPGVQDGPGDVSGHTGRT